MHMFALPKWTDTWNIRAKLPAKGPDVGDIWRGSPSVQGLISTPVLLSDVPVSFRLQDSVLLKCVLSFRMCLGIRPSSPSRHSVLWSSKETKESIFSNGEPNTRQTLLWARDDTHFCSGRWCNQSNSPLQAAIFPGVLQLILGCLLPKLNHLYLPVTDAAIACAVS